MHKLIEYTCDKLEEIERKVAKGGDLSMSELQYADTLAHMKKNLMKADELSEQSEYSGKGYSRRMSMSDGSYAGESMARSDSYYIKPDGSYARNNESYARGRGAGARRDSMGRYSRDGESMDEHTKEELMKLIERM